MREFFDSIWQVVDFIHGLERVNNLEVEQGVDLHLNVVFCNHVLLVEVIHLFAQVDDVGVAVAAVFERDYHFCAVNERHDDVHAGL